MDDKQSKISFISEILLSQTDSKLNLLLQNTLVNYTMDSMKPSIPLSHVPEPSTRTSPKPRVTKKDTLSLSKFDKLLLDVSKQKLSI
jgi:hypothetical protein